MNEISIEVKPDSILENYDENKKKWLFSKQQILEYGKIRSSESIGNLALALSKAQGELENAKKGRINTLYNSKYAELSEVLNCLREPLSTNGLAIIQLVGGDEINTSITTRLCHASGEFIETTISSAVIVKTDKNGTRTFIQSQGIICTYLRRYSLAAIVGIAQEDDDSNGVTAVDYVTNEQVRELFKLTESKPEKEKVILSKYKSYANMPASKYKDVVAYINAQ